MVFILLALLLKFLLKQLSVIILLFTFHRLFQNDYFRSVIDVLGSTTLMFNSDMWLVVGDFNVPEFVQVVDSNRISAEASSLVDLMEFLNLHQCSSKLLDLVLSNINCLVTK